VSDDDTVTIRRVDLQAARIGAVEILRQRIYPLDAESHDKFYSTVIVEPGMYDLYSNGMTTYWLMRGRINLRGFERLGDGLFGMRLGDEPSDIEVVFPSRRFGPDEWAALIAEPNFTEGHADQRMRVTLTVDA
jgi:hypothetical protein